MMVRRWWQAYELVAILHNDKINMSTTTWVKKKKETKTWATQLFFSVMPVLPQGVNFC